MNNSFGGARRRGAKFSLGHIIGDPFALATVSISLLGWITALIGSILTSLETNFNRFYWWGLAYTLCSIVGVTVVILTATSDVYQIALVGFLSIAFTYNTFAVGSLIFSDDGRQQAGAAGFILLSMVCLVWIAYFGSSIQAGHRGYIDSFALNKEQRMSMAPGQSRRPMSTGYRPDTTNSEQQQRQMYTSAQLGGMEASSPVSGYPGGNIGAMRNNSQPQFGAQVQQSPARSPVAMQQEQPPPPSDLGAPTEYPYRAKAIYSYEANPDDANEISFTKHEILEVSDVSGRGWQAKKENGETGIAPSNYLILL